MAIFTVHAPPGIDDPVRLAERLLFIRDGFSFWAFLAPPLWLIARRLWLELAGWTVLAAAVGAAGRLAGPGAGFWLELIFALWFALQARELRRWALERRRWRLVAVVEAGDAEAAERRFFAHWSGAVAEIVPPPPARRGPPSGVARASAPAVIGLFPAPN